MLEPAMGVRATHAVIAAVLAAVVASAGIGCSTSSGEEEGSETRARETAKALQPQGTIAYVVATRGKQSIVTEALDGRARRVHALGDVRVGELALTENGRFAAFVGSQRGREDIYVLDLDRDVLRPLGIPPEVAKRGLHGLAWSPDRTSIAFLRSHYSRAIAAPRCAAQRPEDLSIQVVDADGSGLRVLQPLPANAAPIAKNPTFIGEPAWSPDGRQLLYTVSQGWESAECGYGPRRETQVVRPVSGGEPAVIATVGLVDGMSWSPDGRRVVILPGAGDEEWGVVADVAARTTRQLSPRAGYFGVPVWTRLGIYALAANQDESAANLILEDPDPASPGRELARVTGDWPSATIVGAPADGRYVALVEARGSDLRPHLRVYTSGGDGLIDRDLRPVGAGTVEAVSVAPSGG